MSFKQGTNISNRFLREAARPLQLFLLAIGVPFMVTSPVTAAIANDKWILTKKILSWIWSSFWLILNFQSQVYMFIHRVIMRAFKTLLKMDQLTGNELTESFTSALFWSTSLLAETSTHFMLVLTIRSTLTRFCLALEKIDQQLGQPTLTGVRKGSLAALAFIFYRFTFHLVCAIIWELDNPVRTFVLTTLVQYSIFIGCQTFTLTALLLFVLCGQLLIAYHQRAVKELEHYCKMIERQRPNQVMEDVWLVLSQFRSLIEVRRHLYKDFRFILLANVCLSFVTILGAAYYVLYFIWSPHKNKYFSNMWDICDIAEFLIRFWLICHINDCIHSSAADCIPVLRRIRDKMIPTDERRKLTLFIVEVAQSLPNHSERKDVGGLHLFTMISISKRSILQFTTVKRKNLFFVMHDTVDEYYYDIPHYNSSVQKYEQLRYWKLMEATSRDAK